MPQFTTIDQISFFNLATVGVIEFSITFLHVTSLAVEKK